MFGFLLTSGIAVGSLYALIALSIVILYKASSVVSFAHGEQMMLAGYFIYAFHVIANIGYAPAAVLAVAGAAGLGVLTFYAGFRPLIGQSMMSILIAPPGIPFIMRGVARFFGGGSGEYPALPPVASPMPIEFASVAILPQQLVVVVATVCILVAFSLFFSYTRMGKWMQATAGNMKTARLVGIPVERVLLTTFALAGGISGAAAVLMAPLTMIYPDMGFLLFLKGFAAAILGGLASLRGAVIGGLVLGLIEQFGAGYVHTGLQELSAFLVIMIMLVIKPQGLLGGPAARRV